MSILNIVAVLIKSDDEILLLKRNKLPYKGYYAFPGGKIEMGESLKSAAIREVLEETSIKINLDDITVDTVLNEIVVNEEKKTIYHFLLVYFTSEVQKQAIDNITSEGMLNWYSIDNLPDPIIPSDKNILESHLNNNSDKPNIINCKMLFSMEDEVVDLDILSWDTLIS